MTTDHISRLAKTTTERVTALVAGHLGRSPADLADDIPLSDLGATSLDKIELVIAVEDEFGVEISDDAIETINTIAGVAMFVGAALNTRPGGANGPHR